MECTGTFFYFILFLHLLTIWNELILYILILTSVLDNKWSSMYQITRSQTVVSVNKKIRFFLIYFPLILHTFLENIKKSDFFFYNFFFFLILLSVTWWSRTWSHFFLMDWNCSSGRLCGQNIELSGGEKTFEVILVKVITVIKKHYIHHFQQKFHII